LIEYLEHIDKKLLLLINGWNSPFSDGVMILITGTLTWIPFYIFLLVLLYRNQKGKFWMVLVFVGILICAADQLSVHGFKEVFQRYRPCHNLELKQFLHLPNGVSGGKYGFVSSHATNTFALAGFVSLCLRKVWIYVLLFLWASLVSYSRIYLGVHYPSDILGGAILGLFIAIIFYYLYKKVTSRLFPNTLPAT